MQFADADGNAYAGVKVYHYVSGTTTDKNAWVDSGKSATAQQPVQGDSRGVVSFYGDGSYRLLITTNDGIGLYDWQDVDISGRTTGTATRIPYFAASGALTEDDDLTWNETNKRLGVGTTTNITERIVMPTNSYLGAERSTASSGEGAQKIIGLDPADHVAIDPGGLGIDLSPLTINSALYIDSDGILKPLTMTSGQLIIGSTGTAPVLAQLTAGTGVTITNAAGGITIAATGASVYNRTVTTATIANTTTETSLYSLTIGAGDLSTNKAMHVVVAGDALNATGGNKTIQFIIKFGSTTLWDDTTILTTTSASRRAFRLEFDLINQNSANIQILNGRLTFSPVSSAATGTGDTDATDITAGTIYGTATEASASALLLDVRIVHQTASASAEIKRAYAYAVLY